MRHGLMVMVIQYTDGVITATIFRRTITHLQIEILYPTILFSHRNSIVTSMSKSPLLSRRLNICTNMFTKAMIVQPSPYNVNKEKQSMKYRTIWMLDMFLHLNHVGGYLDLECI